MRFAYIDSQGKEVAIPSTDALRLRIELGAIVDTTEFYDSSTDKWGPAVESEIYRTLKRELDGDEGGFVAPPPPSFEAPTPVEPTPAEPEPEEALDMGALAPDPVADADEEPTLEVGDLQPDAGDDPAAADDLGSLGDLTFTDLPAEPSEDSAEESGGDLDFSFGDLTVADDDDGDDDDAEEDGAAETSGGGFDMGDFGDLGFADEEAPATDEAPRWNVAEEFGDGGPSDSFGQDAEPAPTDENLVTDDLMAGFDAGDALGGGEETASWLADDEPVADTSSGADEEAPRRRPVPDDLPSRDDLPNRDSSDDRDDLSERPKRRGPPPPPRKLTKSGGGGGAGKMIGLVVVMAVVGAGGWFGYQAIAGGGGAPEEPAFDLPEIPANLEPDLRQFAARASSDMVARMQELPQRTAIPDAPPQGWLLGDYLANASTYPTLVEYWNAYSALLRELRATDEDIFVEAFEARLAEANLTATNTSLLTERGVAGFEAADRDRALVYDQLQAVVDAALELHRFLVENEENIDYEPASGGLSRDPILEAVPVTEDLRMEMREQIQGITEALDYLGFNDRIDTDALLAVFFEKLEVTGIR